MLTCNSRLKRVLPRPNRLSLFHWMTTIWSFRKWIRKCSLMVLTTFMWRTSEILKVRIWRNRWKAWLEKRCRRKVRSRASMFSGMNSSNSHSPSFAMKRRRMPRRWWILTITLSYSRREWRSTSVRAWTRLRDRRCFRSERRKSLTRIYSSRIWSRKWQWRRWNSYSVSLETFSAVWFRCLLRKTPNTRTLTLNSDSFLLKM